MAETHSIKYYDKKSLTKANDFAIEHNLNRSLEPEVVNALADHLLFPIVQSFEHNDDHLRVSLLLNQEESVWLDISFDHYHDLPVMEMQEPTYH